MATARTAPKAHSKPDPLSTYRAERDFTRTAEPKGEATASPVTLNGPRRSKRYRCAAGQNSSKARITPGRTAYPAQHAGARAGSIWRA